MGCRHRRAATAFPGMQGRPLQLRRLEQRLSQINRLPSSEAVSELRPGDGAGESVLVVDVTQANPWRASVNLDDRGSATTGCKISAHSKRGQSPGR